LLYGRKIAGLSLIFSIAFMLLSLQVSAPYTDTLAITFPIALLYLSLRLVRAGRLTPKIALSAAMGILAVIGSLVKPTVAIAYLALAITGLLWLLMSNPAKTEPNRLYKTRLALGCIAVSAVAMLGIYALFLTTVDRLAILPYPTARAQDNSIPPQHYIAIGLITQTLPSTTEYGSYNDARAKIIAQLPPQERVSNSLKFIREQLTAYGPLGYSSFLIHKANWITSDSTFYAYGEGSNENVRFTHQDGVSKTIRDYMYVAGKHYSDFTNTLQAVWLAILLLIAMQLIFILMNVASRQNIVLAAPRLMLAGILTFLLIFEGRSRYIYLYVPIFIIVALYTLKVFETDPPTRID
jgi:hypothetical protein